MELADLVGNIQDFETWTHAQKIPFFAWYLHEIKKQSHFTQGNVSYCYQILHLEPPANIGPFLAAMERRKPKQALKSAKGYKLVMGLRTEMAKYAPRAITQAVGDLLRNLPESVPDTSEKVFLSEALTCFSVKAYRAAVVMTWCLAFDHLLGHILKNRLAEFNARWLISFPGHHSKRPRSIADREDFNRELKEAETLEIAKDAKVITPDQYKIMKSKLDRRNSAAHPSSISIDQLQAEEYIDDLVKNIIMKLA